MSRPETKELMGETSCAAIRKLDSEFQTLFDTRIVGVLFVVEDKRTKALGASFTAPPWTPGKDPDPDVAEMAVILSRIGYVLLNGGVVSVKPPPRQVPSFRIVGGKN